MANTGQSAKQKKIDLVYRIIKRHPNGIKESEIATELGLLPRTVHNYLKRLDQEGKIYKENHSPLWLALPYESVKLRGIELSPEEAMTLYLAVRLLVKQHDKRNDAAQLALTKLAEVLTGDANVGHEVYEAALELTQRPGDERYAKIFRTMMQAYIYRRKVTITYKPLNQKAFETVFSPYLFEPSAIGYATYAIGHSSIVNDQRTYKLQRIEQATLTREEYDIPSDFPGLEILRNAWSIIHGNELIPVKLRFSPQVAERVRETQWHPSQDPLTDDPDKPGWLIWTARVADLTDLTPWVRSWGADVQVLEPEELREGLKREVKRLMKLYGMQTQQDDPLLPFDNPARLLWAKTNRYHGRDYGQDYDTHPLICHLIDVSQMVCALWDHHLPQATRRYFSHTLNLSEADTRRWLAFLAGLHDLGKACPVFQTACHKEFPQVVQQLQAAGFTFQQADSAAHGLVSAWSLKALFKQELGLDTETAHILAVAIGGHHGTIITSGSIIGLGPRQRGKDIWDTTRLTLFRALAQSLMLDDLSQFSPPSGAAALNTFTMALAGLTSFTDWLGSMNEYFTFVDHQDITLTGYVETAHRQAKAALHKLGWLGWSPPQAILSFDQLFPFPPRPLQEAMAELADEQHLTPPALVIVEAPTGEGKTEAAWYLADRQLAQHQQRGVYVAMPTQATSNQMLSRVKKFIEKRYPDGQTNLLLLHGDAIFSEEMQTMKLAAVGDNPDETVVAHAWFLPKKRSLLAPFAVGTVDQSLLAVLQTKHFFVRLFGLSHKTVIFDEVHAYDTYMNTLLCRLLAWLRQMGTSVILLSATLPSTTRQALVEAYTGQPFDKPVSYPAITWATAQTSEVLETSEVSMGVIPVEASQSRPVALDWLAPDVLIETIRQAVDAGGCVAVLCNTVNQAQEIYRLLDAENLVPDDDLILFHARFPFYLRQKIEKKVLDEFGKPEEDKPNQRPQKAIVVATQVIEQSLDLDFDLMISALAPVDLILQRAGRLHRHERPRPTGLEMPRLLLIQPETNGDIPQFGVDGRIYAPYILLRSYLALQITTELHVPDDVQSLIEQVYGDNPLPGLSPAWESALVEAKSKLDEEVREQENKARGNLIYPPEDEDMFWEMSKDLDEDNPELHQALRALTRLTQPSITLICLHQTGQGLVLAHGNPTPLDLEQAPDYDLACALANHKVSLTYRTIVNHFVAQPIPTGWQKHPMLRYFRPAIFVDNVCPITPKLSLRFNPKQGIIIDKEDV